jgi:transcription initiation factor TFIID subunit TAF12
LVYSVELKYLFLLLKQLIFESEEYISESPVRNNYLAMQERQMLQRAQVSNTKLTDNIQSHGLSTGKGKVLNAQNANVEPTTTPSAKAKAANKYASPVMTNQQKREQAHANKV